MEETINLKKIDGEVNVITTTESAAPISVEELDRQISETQARLESLQKMRQAISDFKKSPEQTAEVQLENVIMEKK